MLVTSMGYSAPALPSRFFWFRNVCPSSLILHCVTDAREITCLLTLLPLSLFVVNASLVRSAPSILMLTSLLLSSLSARPLPEGIGKVGKCSTAFCLICMLESGFALTGLSVWTRNLGLRPYLNSLLFCTISLKVEMVVEPAVLSFLRLEVATENPLPRIFLYTRLLLRGLLLIVPVFFCWIYWIIKLTGL